MSNKSAIVVMVERLQKRLFVRNIEGVPEDVKEGHFAVIAMDECEERRFVVPMSYLKRVSFVKLLERAAEEYGFEHEGAVVIPCRPSEFERMLAQQDGRDKMLLCKPLFGFTKHN